MVAYYRPLLYASAWQVAAWLTMLAVAVRCAPAVAGGVFWGGLVVAIHFSLMRFTAHLGHRHGGLSRPVLALLGGKLLLLLGLVTAIMVLAEPHPVGLALGLASLFAGIFGAVLHRNAPPLFGRTSSAQRD